MASRFLGARARRFVATTSVAAFFEKRTSSRVSFFLLSLFALFTLLDVENVFGIRWVKAVAEGLARCGNFLVLSPPRKSYRKSRDIPPASGTMSSIRPLLSCQI